jgi:multiple sugar transport system permease protein
MKGSMANLARKRFSRHSNAYLLIAPNFLLLFAFLIVPLVWIIVLSFQGGTLLGPKNFVGLANYTSLINNRLLLKSILNTLKYTVTVIPSVFILGMVVAVLLHMISGLRNLLRAVLFIPLLSSIVVAAIVWRYLVYPEYGPLSVILGWLHIPSPNWFGDSRVVIFTIVAVELWRGLPFYVVTFLAGLQSVPQEMIEAGYIDGVGRLQSLFYIVFPNMRPVLTFCLVMATIWALQLFDSVYVLTRGGPSSASSTIVWAIYENIFFFSRVGRGATMSVVLIVLISLLTIFNLKVTKFQDQGIV